MILVGLTGSIGMGKTTVGGFFAAAGAPVFDADAAVHEFYRGAGARAVEAAFPGVVGQGGVDRAALAARVLGDVGAMARLEGIVHPAVAAMREAFFQRARAQGRRLVVADIPLLLETGGERLVDVVVVVSAPEPVQKARTLTRAGMTEAKFQAIVARQMADRDKRRRAHAVIDTGGTLERTQAQVASFLRCVAAMTGRS